MQTDEKYLQELNKEVGRLRDVLEKVRLGIAAGVERYTLYLIVDEALEQGQAIKE